MSPCPQRPPRPPSTEPWLRTKGYRLVATTVSPPPRHRVTITTSPCHHHHVTLSPTPPLLPPQVTTLAGWRHGCTLRTVTTSASPRHRHCVTTASPSRRHRVTVTTSHCPQRPSHPHPPRHLLASARSRGCALRTVTASPCHRHNVTALLHHHHHVTVTTSPAPQRLPPVPPEVIHPPAHGPVAAC